MSVAEFEATAEAIRNLATRPSNEELLKLYGLYKQATVGDNNTSQPWAIQVEARAKWDAWEANKGMSQEAARQEYIEYAKTIINRQ